MTPLLLAALLLAPAEEEPRLTAEEARICSEALTCDCHALLEDRVTWVYHRCDDRPDTLKDPDVSVIAGGTVVLGSGDTPATLTPLGSIAVDWLLAGKERHLDAHVEADFTGLPDAEVTFTDARDFDALEMSGFGSYRPSRALSASVYCEAGFASRFASAAAEPKTSAPLWGSCGLLFVDKGDSKARLRVGVGPDERLGYGWTMAAHVKGSIRLLAFGRGERYGVMVLVRAILGMETPVGQKQRINQINAGLGMSWGR